MKKFKIIFITDTHMGFSKVNDIAQEQMLMAISEEKPDLIVHTGDIGSHATICIDRFFSLLRLTPGLEKTKVLACLGNHDWWKPIAETQCFSPELSLEENKAVMERCNIKYAGDGTGYSYLLKDNNTLTVFGLDGWYHSDPLTNDGRMIPGYYTGGIEWLRKRANNDFTKIIDLAEKKKSENKDNINILATHFGFLKSERDKDWKAQQSGQYFGGNPRFEDNLKDIDYLATGHAHMFYETVASNGTTQCFSPGSDYEFPRFKILEV